MKVVPEQPTNESANEKKKVWSTPKFSVEKFTQAEAGAGVPLDGFIADGSGSL